MKKVPVRKGGQLSRLSKKEIRLLNKVVDKLRELSELVLAAQKESRERKTGPKQK